MDSCALRNYLAQPPCGSEGQFMQDAVLFKQPGAVALLQLVLDLRVNRRSRRSIRAVEAAFNAADKPRWYGVLVKHCWNMYRFALTIKSKCLSQDLINSGALAIQFLIFCFLIDIYL